MLETLRENRDSWLTKILIVLICLGFAVWGTTNIFAGGTPTYSVGAVGDTYIPSRDFKNQVDRIIEGQAQQTGVYMTYEEAYQRGVHTYALQSLSELTAFEADGRRLGMRTHPSVVADLLARQGAADEITGELDEERVRQVAQRQNMTYRQFRNSIGRQALALQVEGAVTGGFEAPTIFGNILFDYQNEQRVISYITLSNDDVEQPQTPDDTTLQGYLNNHQSRYTEPEYRKISLIYVTATGEEISPALGLTRMVKVTDEEIKAQYDYEVSTGQLGAGERRSILQFNVTDEDQATRVIASLESGTPISEILTTESLSAPTDYDNALRPEIIDPEVASLAFDMEEPGYGIVEGLTGWSVVYVSDISESDVPPLSSERSRIEEQLKAEAASGRLYELSRSVQESINRGTSLEDVARNNELPYHSYDYFNRQGVTRQGDVYLTIRAVPDIRTAAFAEQPGWTSDFQETAAGGAYFALRVDDVIEGRPKTLDEVREQVIADWTREQLMERQSEKLGEIRAQMAQGKSLAEAKDALGLTGEIVTVTTSRFNMGENIPEQLVYNAFETAEGDVVSSPSQSGTNWVIGTVDDIIASQDTQVGTAVFQGQLSDQIAGDVRGAYIAAVKDELGTRTFDQNILRDMNITPDTGAP